MLAQLIYVSHRDSNCTEQEIDNILQACVKNNKGEDITGVLLYSGKYFLQYLEGEFGKITALYDKIREDKRHKNPVMVSTGPIPKRSFPSWQMGAKKFNDQDYHFVTDMKPHEQKMFSKLLNGEGVDGHRAQSLIKKFFG
jgi:hypothetical protein